MKDLLRRILDSNTRTRLVITSHWLAKQYGHHQTPAAIHMEFNGRSSTMMAYHEMQYYLKNGVEGYEVQELEGRYFTLEFSKKEVKL